jgi:hypothetical protein
MKRVLRGRAAWLAAALTLACAAGAWASEPPGLVIDVQGNATLAGTRVAILTGLPPGAEVTLAPAARVVVVHTQNGRQFELIGPGAFRWTSGKVEVVRPGELRVRESADAAFGDLRLRTGRIAQASISMRGAPGESRLQLVSPASTWLLEPPRSFRWQPVTGAASYRFQLTDSNGKPLHEARTSSSSVELPAGVALEAGRTYGWQVQADLAGGRAVDGWTEFGVAGPDLRARVDRARPRADASFGDRLLYALLLDELGMREEAERFWTQLARERPDDRDLAARAQR